MCNGAHLRFRKIRAPVRQAVKTKLCFYANALLKKLEHAGASILQQLSTRLEACAKVCNLKWIFFAPQDSKKLQDILAFDNNQAIIFGSQPNRHQLLQKVQHSNSGVAVELVLTIVASPNCHLHNMLHDVKSIVCHATGISWVLFDLPSLHASTIQAHLCKI